MRVCACEHRCLQSPEVVGHLGAGLIGSYVLSNMVAGNRTLGLYQNNEKFLAAEPSLQLPKQFKRNHSMTFDSLSF